MNNDDLIRRLDLYISKAVEGKDTTLIPRQLETIRKIRDFLALGNKDGHVVNPTGIGKTVVFSKFLEAVLAGTDLRALIVGPTKIILHQNRWKLEMFGDIEAGAFYGPEKNLTKQVTVTTYHSLRNAVAKGTIIPADYDILILDEAHRALGEETLETIDLFETAIKIGFTATPEFHEEKCVADLLPFAIDEMSVREAIEASLLAGLKVLVTKTGVLAAELSRVGRDYEEWALEKTVNIPERNAFIARIYKNDERLVGKRCVVYAASRKHAQDLTAAFTAAGIITAYIDGQTPEDDREDLFLRFKEGTLSVLCNARVLVEGFDEPEAEVCINAAPTLSKVVAEQRGGRVLRRSRVKDQKIGYIVEVLDEFGESGNTPVLFSEIAGAAEILPLEEKTPAEKKKGTASVKPKTPRKPQEGEIIDDPDVIMDLTNKNKRQRFEKMFEYAPRGWAHARRLCRELHVKESDVRNIAESHRGHEGWFKRYLTPTDILITHYHPHLSNLVRRHFDPTLKESVTVEEFANKAALPIDRAEGLLEAADTSATQKAIRFGDIAFYPEKEHEAIIRAEERTYRLERAAADTLADERFWEEDDRTDDEREAEYWESFSGSLEELEDLNLDIKPEESPELLPFDDEHYLSTEMEGLELQHSSHGLSAALKVSLQALPDLERKAIELYYFRDITYKEAGRKFGGRSTERMRQLANAGLRILRNPKSGLSNLISFGTEADASIEVDRLEEAREEIYLLRTPLKLLAEKLINLHRRLAEIKRGACYVASWEKEYYELITPAFFNSFLPSHETVIEHFAHAHAKFPKRTIEELLNAESLQWRVIRSLLCDVLVKIVLMRPACKALQKRVEWNMSPDNEMLRLYDVGRLYQELESIKDWDKAIRYYSQQIAEQQSDEWRIHLHQQLTHATKSKKKLAGRRSELLEYFRRYNTHFK